MDDSIILIYKLVDHLAGRHLKNLSRLLQLLLLVVDYNYYYLTLKSRSARQSRALHHDQQLDSTRTM